MASLYGAEYTDAFVDVPSEKVDVSKWGGRLRVAYGSYTIAADVASGDKLYLAKLPKGAIVYNAVLAFTDLDGSGGTLDVGYEYNATGDSALTDDLDAFLADVDVTSAGTVGMIEQANMVGFGKEMEGEADIVVVFDGDTDATSGTIKLMITYAID